MIQTKDTEGKINGWLMPIWNVTMEPDLRPDQVYLTAATPGSRKGPHLHKERRGLFVLLAGTAILRIRTDDGEYKQYPMLTGEKYLVPPGVPCALYSGSEGAFILNMPSPAWTKDNPDEWPVEVWEDPEGWK